MYLKLACLYRLLKTQTARYTKLLVYIV